MSLWPILISLIIMGTAVRQNLHAGYAILTGNLALLISTAFIHSDELILRAGGSGLVDSLQVLTMNSFVSAFSWPAWNLYLTITGINILGKLLVESGDINIMTGIIRRSFKDIRPAMGILPALIGLLPMPGGTIFSAPFVQSTGALAKMSPRRLAIINYWFRHVWEYVFPLYPGLIMFMDITDLDYPTVFSRHLLITLTAISAGLFICYYHVPRVTNEISRNDNEEEFLKSRTQLILKALWPVITLVLMALIFPKSYMALVLLFVLLLYIYSLRSHKDKIPAILKNSPSLNMAALVFGVYAFRAILESLNMASDITAILTSMNLPPVLVFGLSSMLLAFILGYTPAVVGIMLPLTAPMMKIHGSGIAHFAYCCTFLGVLLSPFHLCLSLSVDFFKITWGAAYRALLPPTIVLSLVMTGMLWLWP